MEAAAPGGRLIFVPNHRLDGEIRMLESIVELIVYLFMGAMTIVAGSCVVGSVVVALRAVGRGSAVNTRR
jgi:hypothetical protein